MSAVRLKVPHQRFVHADDVVPHMPTALCGFRHTCPPTMLEHAKGMILNGVRDHAMTTYRRLVN